MAQSEPKRPLPFQRIQLNGDEVMPQPGQPLLMQREQNTLVFWISGPFPNQPTHFSYQIQAKTGWISVDSASAVVLKNLPLQPTVVQIRAETKNQFRLNFLILVPQPFWQNWWFWPLLSGVMLLVVSTFIWLFYQYRLRQFMRLQLVRDRIARDLHDDMGSYLSSISILSQTAHRSATKDPAKTQATLTQIGQTARQVMDSMGDIVWSINPTHDSMNQVVARMTDVASGLFADESDSTIGTALQMDVADDVRQMSLSAENRRDFFLIYKEAITNAARYAQANRVRVALRREGGYLVLTVQDNGRGFDPQNPVRQNPSGGNGLRNMQTRAALLGGTLMVESAEGQGTTVSLRFPA